MNATVSPPPLTDVPERIARLIYLLCQIVTERTGIRVRTLTVAQANLICRPLLAARTRFRRVVELIRAGKPPKVRARKKRARPAKPPRPAPMTAEEMNSGFAPPPGWRRWARVDRALARAAAKAARLAAKAARPVPMWQALRMHVPGWLYNWAPAIYDCPGSAAACAETLRKYLAEPEMQALLASNRHVGDSLSKVIHALNIDRSLIYPEPENPPAPVADQVAAGPEPAVEPRDEKTRAKPPAAAPLAPARNVRVRPAAKRPPPTAERAPPTPPYRPGSGVVIIDYWDLPRD